MRIRFCLFHRFMAIYMPMVMPHWLSFYFRNAREYTDTGCSQHVLLNNVELMAELWCFDELGKSGYFWLLQLISFNQVLFLLFFDVGLSIPKYQEHTVLDLLFFSKRTWKPSKQVFWRFFLPRLSRMVMNSFHYL